MASSSRNGALRPAGAAWSGVEGLRGAEAEWRALASAAGRDPLGQDLDWILAHAEAHARPEDVLGFTVRDGDGPLLVLALRREPRRGRLALRRSLLCGDGTFDADYLEPPVRPGAEPAAARALLDAVAELRSVEAIVLSGVPDDSPLLGPLRGELDRRGWPRRELAVPCCAARLPATYEAYLGALKARMRSKVRSAVRRAEEAGLRLRFTREQGELARDLGTLYDLHSRRWGARGEPGSFADPARRRFYELFAPRLLARGALRLALLEEGGRPVAAQIGPALGGTYYQLQEGFDPERAEERVGTALRALCVRRFIEEEGLRSYDFMAGVTRHKTDWGATPRPCTTISFALPRLRARWTFGAKRMAEAWRDRWRGRSPRAAGGGE